jgi:Tol biopolymer transport system component
MRIYLFILMASCCGVSGASDIPLLVSGGTTNITGAGNSMLWSITPNGRWVVFNSHANNLVTNDDFRPYGDLFVRNVDSGVTLLVTANPGGYGGGDGNSSYASITADGRYVVFSSDAANLVANDTNEVSDVFRRDLMHGTTELVSVASSGGVASASRNAPVAGASKPVTTSNGRWIAFESASTEFVPGDTNTSRKVFVRDMETGMTLLASAEARRCWSASLTINASRVAFIANSADAMPGRTNIHGDVFVRDLQTHMTSWASTNVQALLQTNAYRCYNSLLAPDGSFVVFKVSGAGSFLPPVQLVQYDVGTSVTTLLASNSHASTAASLSADGRWLAFEENGSIYLRNQEHGTNLLVSVDTSGASPANGASHGPAVTPDGRHVAFVSSASNLTGDPPGAGTNDHRIYLRDVVAGITHLVTRSTNDTPVAVSGGVQPWVSADGKTVAFDTDAAVLVQHDNNAAYDVFVRDVESSSTVLVSAQHPERVAKTGLRPGRIAPNALSADGQRVAFTSLDDPRVGSDTNGHRDVFVADVTSGALTPQSVDSNGLFVTTRRFSNPFLSADGRHILFESEQPPNDLYSASRRLWWRRVDGGPSIEISNVNWTVRQGSVDWAAAMNSNGTLVVAGGTLYDVVAGTNRYLGGGWTPLRRPMFSPDEKWILGKDSRGSISAMNLESNRLVLVSKDNGTVLSYTSLGAFDASGRYYVFDTLHQYDLPSLRYRILRYDFSSDSTRLIATNAIEPSIDFSGNLIAFSFRSRLSPPEFQVHLMDVTANRTELISGNATGTAPGNGSSRKPVISGDGRYIVFVSSASDLVLGDNNNADDIFAHDRLQKKTVLLTRNYRLSESANGRSATPIMARDGRTVAFQSFASDLVDGDYNQTRDIFVLRLGQGDSDNDGIDDDWEVAYFDNLERNGAGDYDGDGQSDLQEFLSGTDPRNSGSVLRVLTITPMGGGSTTVVWSAVPNRNYAVQYKDSLEAPGWANASAVVTAHSTSESFVHASSAAGRYYRVVLVQ